MYDGEIKFSYGVAYVSREGRFGYIDRTGREVLPCIYEKMDSTIARPFWAKRDGKYGIIDENYKEITPFKYDEPFSYGSSSLLKVFANGKYGFVNRKGIEVIACI